MIPKPKFFLAAIFAGALLASCGNSSPKNTIYACDEFSVYTDSVVQGDFVARAVSPLEITTNYRSPETSGASPVVNFRFSINSRDNEMGRTKTHSARADQPSDFIYTFGSTDGEPVVEASNDTLPQSTQWTVRVDMRPMLRAFARDGFYATPMGDTIYADDFKGVWVAGSVAPMSWDFENLWNSTDRKLTNRGDSIFEATLTLNPPTECPADPAGWRIDAPNPNFPTYASNQTLVDACYNMAIAEIAEDLRPDSCYRAGREWDGVWTRDVSYSIYLSLAYLDPQSSMKSLRAKVSPEGRIIQDTGTGGAWPASSDRIVWALAAWEIYCVTGDTQWLSEARNVIEASLLDDYAVVFDPQYKMMHGEQTYLDWREQTYPFWMQPADIFAAMTLGTNIAFVHGLDVLEMMNKALGIDPDPQSPLFGLKDKMIGAINDNLWQPRLGYYCGYLYTSPYPIPSPATDNLGQALAIIFDVATPQMAQSIIEKTPRLVWGTPSVYPQQADIRPYHNDATWPFVQAYWNLAAAKAHNREALLAGLASIYRAAALFSTNKELFVSHNGDYRGTAINSDAQLWSAAGNAAMVFRVFAGMSFRPDGIEFHPVVPAVFSGDKTISNFKYRNASIDITVSGFGDKISRFLIDGNDVDDFIFPAAMADGKHKIEILMAGNKMDRSKINVVEQQGWLLSTPVTEWTSPTNMTVADAPEGVKYEIWINGVLEQEISASEYTLSEPAQFTQVDIVAVNADGFRSFSPKPHYFIPDGALTLIYPREFATPGTSLIADRAKADRFVELTTSRNTTLQMKVNVPRDGEYFVDVRYANGSGPINTDNKCAIRTLVVNGQPAGAIMMPQRGTDEWLSTGFSNMLLVNLRQGENSLSLDYILPYNMNMNREVNTALVEYIRIIKK